MLQLIRPQKSVPFPLSSRNMSVTDQEFIAKISRHVVAIVLAVARRFGVEPVIDLLRQCVKALGGDP